MAGRAVVSYVMLQSAGVFAVFVVALGVPTGQPPSTGEKAVESAKRGACLREGASLVGREPIDLVKHRLRPRKTRDARPRIAGSGQWLGEVLVDAGGEVVRIWTIRRIGPLAPTPALLRAAVDAVAQWEFAPMIVDGEAVPFCLNVTVSGLTEQSPLR